MSQPVVAIVSMDVGATGSSEELMCDISGKPVEHAVPKTTEMTVKEINQAQDIQATRFEPFRSASCIRFPTEHCGTENSFVKSRIVRRLKFSINYFCSRKRWEVRIAHISRFALHCQKAPLGMLVSDE